jgi:uncharacterized BrkB/YihY/UPF0761 family membrane protein
MNYSKSYVYLIFAVKILFIILAIFHIYLKSKGQTDSNLDKNIVYWKDRIEFIFILLMSFFLIYLFNPRQNRTIDKESKLLLYLFGFVLIITADWNKFLNQKKWVVNIKNVQDIFGLLQDKEKT